MCDVPLVSVIIPTYFRNNRLRNAIESVMSQTYPHIEVIVVDDSGENHAENVISDFDIKSVYHSENRGGNPARNSGIEVASGNIIQLLDDDDYLYPEKIEKQVHALESDDDIGVMFCGYQWEDGESRLPNSNMKGEVLDQVIKFQLDPCITSTMLIDADLIKSIHPLTDRRAADDIGLKIELALQTEFAYINEVLMQRGSPDQHRGSGLDYWIAIDRVTNEYRDLYSNKEYNDIMGRIERKKAIHFAKESYWSTAAILSAFRSTRYDPSLISLLVLFLAATGYLGYKTASSLSSHTPFYD